MSLASFCPVLSNDSTGLNIMVQYRDGGRELVCKFNDA